MFTLLRILALLVATSVSSWATITFSNVPGGDLSPYNGHVEDGFTVTPTSGTWQLSLVVGSPGPSIRGTSAGASAIQVTNGGLFTFTSVQLADAASGGCIVCAGYNIEGFLGGVSQFSFSGTTTSNFSPAYSNPSPNSLIDRLVITMTKGFVTYNVDNIVVTAAVPEPVTLAFTIFGGVGLVAVRVAVRRRRTSGSPGRRLS